MKQKWKYIKYNRLNQKRETIYQVQLAMRGILKIFYKEDQKKIILIMKKVLSFTNIIGTCIIIGLYIAVLSQIENSLLSLLGCICLSIFQIMTGNAKTDIIQIKREYEFFSRNVKKKVKNWDSFFFCYHMIKIFGRDVLIPGILFIGVKIYIGTNSVLAFISGLGTTVILIGFSLLYMRKNWIQIEIRKRKKSEEQQVISIEKLVEKQIKISGTKRFIVMLTTGIVGISILIHFCGRLFEITQLCITVCVISILPTVFNIVFQKILAEGVLREEVLTTNFYIIRKFAQKGEFIKATVRKLRECTAVTIGSLLVLEIIFNKFSEKVIILCICSVIQWISVTILLGLRCFQFEKYDYDEVQKNVIGIMINNILEDYLVIGLPIIFISGSVVAVEVFGNVLMFLVGMIIYTAVVFVYASSRLILKRRQQNVCYKEYNESI